MFVGVKANHLQNKTAQNKINFGERLDLSSYGRSYIRNKSYNGASPDEFIISRLKSQTGKVVLDLGAGQGRNSIPIAKMGYDVMAYEISPDGRKNIVKESMDAQVSDSVKVYGQNILDSIGANPKADFAFMSHISQHFNIDELKEVFKNVKDSMKDGGEFVFDALVRTKDNYKKYDKPPTLMLLAQDNLEKFGAASFKKDDILNAAKEVGFKFVQESPFNEKNRQRAFYEKQNLWGGFRIKDFLSGIPKKPVKLTWFVLRK